MAEATHAHIYIYVYVIYIYIDWNYKMCILWLIKTTTFGIIKNAEMRNNNGDLSGFGCAICCTKLEFTRHTCRFYPKSRTAFHWKNGSWPVATGISSWWIAMPGSSHQRGLSENEIPPVLLLSYVFSQSPLTILAYTSFSETKKYDRRRISSH